MLFTGGKSSGQSQWASLSHQSVSLDTVYEASTSNAASKTGKSITYSSKQPKNSLKSYDSTILNSFYFIILNS